MTDYLWPVDIVPASQTWKIIDPSASYRSPLSGAVRTVSRPGARMGCTITVPPIKGADRARVMAVLSNLRGMSNRIWMPDFSTSQRGSMAAPELLSNNTFSGGTTGWSASSGWGLSALDGAIRATRSANTGAGNPLVVASPVTMIQYAPYAIRYFINNATPAFTIGHQPTYSGLANLSTASLTTGLSVAADARFDTSVYPGISLFDTTQSAGSFLDVSWMSHARCALVDNGPNIVSYSDQLDNGFWQTSSGTTISANDTTAADGTVTADSLIESNTSNIEHYVVDSSGNTVSSAAADYALSVEVSVRTRNFCIVRMVENGSGTAAYACFNISTGAIGTVASNPTAWANHRAFITSLGNGRYRCTLVARKTNSGTVIRTFVSAATADNSFTYAGTAATPAIAVRRMVLAQSSVPTRGAQTTTTATTGTAQTGSRMYLKGLPASTSGLLRVGDPVQIGNQINFCTAQLDSDAAGLGVLQVGLPWRVSPADNDPVIFNRPMAKMMLADSSGIEWDTQPGQFSGFTLDLVEDVT